MEEEDTKPELFRVIGARRMDWLRLILIDVFRDADFASLAERDHRLLQQIRQFPWRPPWAIVRPASADFACTNLSSACLQSSKQAQETIQSPILNWGEFMRQCRGSTTIALVHWLDYYSSWRNAASLMNWTSRKEYRHREIQKENFSLVKRCFLIPAVSQKEAANIRMVVFVELTTVNLCLQVFFSCCIDSTITAYGGMPLLWRTRKLERSET